MTTLTIRYIASAALLISLLATGCKTIRPREEVETKETRVNELFARWDRANSPGAAVVVVKDGKVVYQRGFGSANLETLTPITPQTAFDAASVAKQFTGLAIAMLIEQGKLSLDDEVRKYLPELPDFGRPITIRHLLYHTSGLRDWPETLGLSGIERGAIITMDTIMEMVRRQQELDFTPGDEYQYCNTSYNLLAAVIAKVTGQSFRAWTDANLFEPLGMKDTHFCANPMELIANRAESYTAAGGGREFRRNVSQLAAQGSSSLFITAEDMGKWLRNFQTQRLGGKSAFERMYEPGKRNDGRKIDYGFGVSLDDYRGDKTINHGGGWAGYRSFVLHIPEKNLGVGILGNAGDINSSRLAWKIADVYLGYSAAPENKAESPTKPVAAKFESATWDSYLGTYRLGAGWLLEITRAGDQLHAQATREDKVMMTPLSDSKFFVSAYDAPVEFAREKSGSVTHLLYRGIRAPKLELPKLTPAQLQGYVGDYWSEELWVAYRIEIRDGQLGVRHRTGEWVRLLPTATDRFDLDQGRASIEFTRNAGSEVMELKVSGGRVRNIRFVRGILPRPNQGTIVN